MPLFCDAESTVLLLSVAAALFVVAITVKQQTREVEVKVKTVNTRQYAAPVIVDHPGNLGIIDIGIPNYRDSWNINQVSQVSAMSP